MKKIIGVSLLVIVLSCDEEPSRSLRADWKKLGLEGKTVNEMKVSGSDLYVATTSGLFKLSAASDDFQLIGFNGKNVEALEILRDDDLIVSIFDRTGAEPPSLLRTDDDGQTWREIATNFGGDIREPIFDLETHPDDDHLLLATGYAVVARSNDLGATWNVLYGEWGGFATGLSVVEVSPLNTEIWAGGQGGIENGILLRSADGVEWESWSNLVENPTVVKEITFSVTNPKELFVGFEGALLKTDDNGEHWQTLIHSEDTRFFFGVSVDPGDPERVYAGGWLKTPDPQPLLLFISKDGGNTWSEVRYPTETYGGILDMQIKEDDGNDVIYVGLDKGGVYQVTIHD